MTPAELVKVLVRVQADDNRDIGQVTVASWQQIIGHLDFQDAIAAVVMHRQESTDWLMPAHVLRNAARVRARRERVERVNRSLGRLPSPRITLDREQFDAETQKWVDYYRQHPEER